MACTIEISEKPKLNDPILIEGLPGIGFVANIACLHLINELKAQRFAEVVSAYFQDLAVTTDMGGVRTPISELYYYKREDKGRDIIIWYGNTQAMTSFGQYELCGKVLDIAQELGCRFVISIGGYKKGEVQPVPGLYCAATDGDTLKEAVNLGTKIMVGHIFGIAGLLIGLGRLRDLKGFALLVDTPGLYPDINATRYALTMLVKYLNLNIDLSRLDATLEQTKKMLEPFGLIRNIVEERKKEEQQMRWFI
ncbi:MAG: PAC2 family protein [Candidatus Bathyarchaeota archaeon]|nr:PAC2 family protein [Candidatus Bathyarchaeota archaeon]